MQLMLTGDEGGLTYVVWPATRVRATDDAVQALNEVLDCIYLDIDEPDDRSCPPGHYAPPIEVSGAGGAPFEIDSGPWVHPDLDWARLTEAIAAVLEGRISSIEPSVQAAARSVLRTRHAEEIRLWREEQGLPSGPPWGYQPR